ncbi:plasmid mobilization protein [Glaciimonas sp. GG7]
MTKTKLFHKKSDNEKRTEIIRFRTTSEEKLKIYQQAAIRSLEPSEYIRRTALHRRADVRIELDMILALNGAVRALKELHAAYLKSGLTPPLPSLQPILNSCENAIINLSNY